MTEMLSQLSKSQRDEASDDIHIEPAPLDEGWPIMMLSVQALQSASALRLSRGVGDIVAEMARLAAGMGTGVIDNGSLG